VLEHKVILTWEAVCDVNDITDYIEIEFGKDRADEFEDDIKYEMQSLGYMPEAYPQTQLIYRGYIIRKKPFKPSVIFYIVEEHKKEVHILRVLREEQNWGHILSTQDKYTYPEE
jgi:plasmid stabilization system protein ParE